MRPRLIAGVCLSLLVIAGICTQLHAGIRYVEITVLPARAIAPVDVTPTVRLADDDRNRALIVILAGDNYYRRSDLQLDGERIVQIRPFQHVPSGRYTAWAIVRRVDGSEASARTDVCFIGPTEECQ